MWCQESSQRAVAAAASLPRRRPQRAGHGEPAAARSAAARSAAARSAWAPAFRTPASLPGSRSPRQADAECHRVLRSWSSADV